MFTTTPAAPVQDPSLAALVPRPSPWRNAAAVLLGLALLVAVGVVGVQTRISVVDNGGGAEVAPDGRILEEHHVVVTGWPRLTVTSVTAAPGTRVIDSWLVPASAPIGAHGDSVAALVDALEADGARYRLPRAIVPGLEYHLVLASQVLSCSTLVAASDQGAGWTTMQTADGAPAEPSAPTVHLRTGFGTQRDAALFSIRWDRETLDTYGSCPD